MFYFGDNPWRLKAETIARRYDVSSSICTLWRYSSFESHRAKQRRGEFCHVIRRQSTNEILNELMRSVRDVAAKDLTILFLGRMIQHRRLIAPVLSRECTFQLAEYLLTRLKDCYEASQAVPG